MTGGGSFGAHLSATLTGAALTMLLGTGHRLGLFDAGTRGPGTAAEIAERAGLHERYVREWLTAMVTGGVWTYDPTDGRYTLPAEHAVFLTGDTAANAMPTALMLRAFGAVLPEVERAFVDGGGVAQSVYRGPLADVGIAPGDTWRRIYDEHLVDGFLAAVPGLVDRLRAGARVLDLGCGAGHAVTVAARAFPSSTFEGIDIDADVIALAEAERAELGLRNATFTVVDAAELAADPGYDVILAFDAVHDQRDPATVLRRVRDALAPGGIFVMVDANFSSDLADNVGRPLAALCAAISLLYCVPTTMADGGQALGAMWGTGLAQQMLVDAGFTVSAVLPSPRPQNCIVVAAAAPLVSG